MSPIPIIARQRALSRIGEIRIGAEKPDKGAGKKLEAFRLTSQHKDVIDRCAGLYGGTPSVWQSPSGEAWQLYTTSSSLPVLLIVDYSLNQAYEMRDGQSCIRRCDGETEMLTGEPCLCNAQGLEGENACTIITRLMVVLPETGTSLGWQLRSQGENAARELSGAVLIAQELSKGSTFVPATLRLTQRRSVMGGQTFRYAVPVLDFNLLAQAALQQAEQQAGQREIGYTPVPARELEPGITVEQGLAGAAASAAPKTTNSRSAAPIPQVDVDDIPFGEPVPVPSETAEPVKLATKPQKDKLGVLVGRLRPDHVTTEQLYRGLGRDVPGPGEDGDVHLTELWATLTRQEATDLIDRLVALEQRVAA